TEAVEPGRDLVTHGRRDLASSQPQLAAYQTVELGSHLVTVGKTSWSSAANTPDERAATPGRGRRSPNRGNRIGSSAEPATGAGSRACWLCGNLASSSTLDAADCVDPGRTTPYSRGSCGCERRQPWRGKKTIPCGVGNL